MAKKRTVRIEVKKNRKGRWFWTARASNGRKFFGSVESDGFRSKAHAVRNFRSVEAAFKAGTCIIV